MLRFLLHQKTLTRKVLIDKYGTRNPHKIPTIRKVTVNTKVDSRTYSILTVLKKATIMKILLGSPPRIHRATRNLAALQVKKGRVLSLSQNVSCGTKNRHTNSIEKLFLHTPVVLRKSTNVYNTLTVCRNKEQLHHKIGKLPYLANLDTTLLLTTAISGKSSLEKITVYTSLGLCVIPQRTKKEELVLAGK